MERVLVDSLTGIHNDNYLRRNYQEYVTNHPGANIVMIDFEKFKNINDKFGHAVGDEYLKTFARILESNFRDSIVVRLHGDEFAILTKCSEDEIEMRFKLCDNKISLAVDEGRIPRIFGYNAGSAKAEHGIDNSEEKADYMMYHAKQNHMRFQKFSQSILQNKIEHDKYLKEVTHLLQNDEFHYTKRPIYNIKNEKQNMYQIYTKGHDGKSIFDNGRYTTLKETSKLAQFDIYNIQNLLENIKIDNNKMIITVDYKSIILSHDVYEYMILLKSITNMSFENIILSIDLTELDVNNCKNVIERINELKDLGFKIRLEKFNNEIVDMVWENTNSDYLKISNNYWKNAMSNPKTKYILQKKVEMYDGCHIVPVFDYVEKKDEYEELKKIVPSETLFSGNYFSGEEDLKFKR